jgi:hypothetical protein
MKQGITLLIVLLFAGISTSSFAQIRFGAKAGVNIANVTVKNDPLNGSYKSLIGFHIGITAEVPLSEKLFFEPALLFSTKGFKFDNPLIKGSTNINNLELPLNLTYKFDVSSLKLFALAGPYVGLALSGKTKVDGQDSESIKIGNNKDEDKYKPLDFGLNLGAGVEIRNITIGIQYGFGLASISTTTANDFSMKNNVIGISVGYKF